MRKGTAAAGRRRLLLDRYLATTAGLVDLATGRRVRVSRRRAAGGPPLFAVRRSEVLIDIGGVAGRRVEVWERRRRFTPCDPDIERAFVELLGVARHGVPRVLDLRAVPVGARPSVVRRLAREARSRGWLPMAAALLPAHAGPRCASWLRARSLVVFANRETHLQRAVATLARLGRLYSRPHVVVRLCRRGSRAGRAGRLASPMLARERSEHYGRGAEDAAGAAVCRARWGLLTDTLCGARADAVRSAVALASMLAGAGRRFEARSVMADAGARGAGPERRQVTRAIERASRGAAAEALGAAAGMEALQEGRWSVVDDFVGVLRLCQDIEDERVALARVGAFVRERLQAATVAFVVREGPGARAIASAGLDQPRLDAAVTAIESGCAVAARTHWGPTESAAPVRYAADVIGALWARWSAGVPVSRADAVALLGVAAVAAAPSLRGVLDSERRQPVDADVPELVGASEGMRAVREAVLRAAASPFPVLIEGESGVGKELVAHAIHSRSARRDRRFSAVNCAALADELVEAELFGHARGAFTGAHVERAGLFEEASGGTIFLDEVAELGTRVQAKLLRTLQEGEIRRIGESRTRRVDVRVIAATNRPLAAEVSAGRFRLDLRYRLDVIRITVPPVRERLEDIPLLVRHAWRELAPRIDSRAVLSASAAAALSSYDWPGNVRELQNVLASILVSAPRRGVLGPALLPAHVARAAALAPAGTLEAARRQFETRFVRAALARANGRAAVAARELGLSRQGLAKALVRLGLATRDPTKAHVE